MLGCGLKTRVPGCATHFLVLFMAWLHGAGPCLPAEGLSPQRVAALDGGASSSCSCLVPGARIGVRHTRGSEDVLVWNTEPMKRQPIPPFCPEPLRLRKVADLNQVTRVLSIGAGIQPAR